MPKRINMNEITELYQAYLVYGSMERTAAALNLPLHKIKRAVYQATGRCLCGRSPVEGLRTCQKCLDRSRQNTAKLHAKRASENTCRECGEPLASTSKRFCEYHLEKLRLEQMGLRQHRRDNNICRLCTNTAVQGKAYCEVHLPIVSGYAIRNRSRYQFGGLLEAVLERDNHQCRICSSKEPRVEVHHIRGRVNTMENLITLCVYCHKAVTFLNYCRDPESVYAWFLDHRP